MNITSAQLFAAMQSGKPLQMHFHTRCVVPVGPARIIGMQPESGTKDIYCWNVDCVDLASGREYTTFVRCDRETA